MRLRDELNKGYFADVKAMKQQNGRAFLSELELVAKVDSSVFPHVACNDLRGLPVAPAELMRGKCSFVTVAMRDSADRDLQLWVSGLGLREPSCPWNWIELSFIDNWLLKTMSAQVTAKLAEKVPPHRHASYLVSYSDAAIAQAVLGMPNKFSAYVFLVDTEARVRWRASGPPSAEYMQFVQDAQKSLSVKAAGEKARKML